MYFFDQILSLIAPHHCLVCGADSNLLCDWCRADSCLPTPGRCYGCRRVSSGSRVCLACRKRSRLQQVWVATDFESVAKELVYKLKFGRAMAAAKTIAAYLDETVPILPKDTIVVHVPTATSRVRQRGYDQSRLIARHFAARRNLPCSELLIRQGHARQVGTKREERLRQMEEAFTAVKPNIITGANILLIDDVLTTGATIEQAARTLKTAGAKNINAAIFAQAT